ncbi:MAG: nucleoid-associated protein [Cellulosilyticum sp.]|nr:nucleoid-associated protein [Cellulosilyticum sp.]
MSITFKHTVIHVLDLSMGMPLLSTDLLVLNDETESFITRHLIKIFESSSSCEAIFKENAYLPSRLEGPLTEDLFMELTSEITNTFYRYMTEYENIPSGDLVFTSFMMDGENYFGILKLNYKEEYTHFVEQVDGTVVTRIIKNKGIFPAASKQVDEGLIIAMDSLKVSLLDNSKGKYISLMFDLEPALSIKETIKAIETVATKVIEQHYDNPINAMTELKNNISESISRTQTIPVQEILEQTFGADEEVFESCIQHIEEYGIKEAKVEVTDPKIGNKFNFQKLKTDTGFEVKLPTHLFKDPDFIEIINEPNGTISIVLKNISQIVNK